MFHDVRFIVKKIPWWHSNGWKVLGFFWGKNVQRGTIDSDSLFECIQASAKKIIYIFPVVEWLLRLIFPIRTYNIKKSKSGGRLRMSWLVILLYYIIVDTDSYA